MLCDLGISTGVTDMGQFCCRSQWRRTLKSGGKAELTASSAVTEGQMQLNINVAVMQLQPGPKMYVTAHSLLYI